jgi:hypothetical protein
MPSTVKLLNGATLASVLFAVMSARHDAAAGDDEELFVIRGRT